MKFVWALAFACLTVATARSGPRVKRQAYALPDGAELLVGTIRSTFSCNADGYFADVDNECQIFHVCNTVTSPEGDTEIRQHSFLCGNQTVFNQFSLTCAHPDEAIPCNQAPNFYFLNERIGQETVNIHTEDELQQAQLLYPGSASRQK